MVVAAPRLAAAAVEGMVALAVVAVVVAVAPVAAAAAAAKGKCISLWAAASVGRVGSVGPPR